VEPQPRSVVFRSSGAGESLLLPPDGSFTFKVLGKHTENRFTLGERIVTTGSGPSVHVHPNEDEAWYVIEGDLMFEIAGEKFQGSPGAFVYAPRGLPVKFTVINGPAKLLVIYSPAGYEEFLRSRCPSVSSPQLSSPQIEQPSVGAG
jgi:mannose-6-phosphate isomerase-like protein (cupin superfamily)